MILTAVAFGWLAHEVADGDHLPLENSIMQSLRREGVPIGPSGLANVMRDVTALGSAAVIGTLTLLIVGYLLLCARYRVAVMLILAIAGGQGVNAALKGGFHRERPESELRLVEVRSPSFPSGHAMAASIFYLTTGALLARISPRRREKVYLMTCALLLGSMIGFSRVYLGVHFPSDVLAGWMAGTSWALACWLATDWLGRRGVLQKETGERVCV